MSHTSGNRHRERGASTASGIASGPACSGCGHRVSVVTEVPDADCARESLAARADCPFDFCRIPDQARIEALCREHRQDHDRAERNRTRSGADVGERLELDDGREQRHHVDVEHRPLADELDHSIELRPLQRLRRRAPPHRQQQVGEREQLRQRHDDARDEHDQREVPRARAPEEHDPAQDRVALRPEQRARLHDRQDVRRHVEDVRGDHQRPGATEAVGLAQVERGAAARAGACVPAHARDQPAVVAACEPETGRGPAGHRSASARAQTSRGSSEFTAAASATISTPNDHSAIPGTIVATWASLTIDTSTPSANTSTIAHGAD